MVDAVRIRGLRVCTVAVVVSFGLLAGCGQLESANPDSDEAETSAPAQDGTAAPGGECGGRIEDLDDVQRLISEPAGCPGSVNTYWAGELGEAWTTPRYIAYRDGEVPQDACGVQVNDPEVFADNALYCSLDDTIAYSVDFMTELFEAGGPAYPMFVIMHELGHRASRIGGTIGVVSRSEENQADCLAGRQTRFAGDVDRLTLTDAFSGALLFFSLGDTRDRGWFDQEAAAASDAHGTPRQRAQAFAYGYLRGVETCYRLGRSSTGSVLF